jgi:hypothetical protein
VQARHAINNGYFSTFTLMVALRTSEAREVDKVAAMERSEKVCPCCVVWPPARLYVEEHLIACCRPELPARFRRWFVTAESASGTKDCCSCSDTSGLGVLHFRCATYATHVPLLMPASPCDD